MSNTSLTRSRKHWPDLPEKPAGQAIWCIGNYRPPDTDLHGPTQTAYTAGCRCHECSRGRRRVYAFGGQRYREAVRPNLIRARRFLDPARLLPWSYSSRQTHRAGGFRGGGPWLLVLAVLYNRGAYYAHEASREPQ